MSVERTPLEWPVARIVLLLHRELMLILRAAWTDAPSIPGL